MIRWGHGHSTLLGVLVGLVLFRGWGVVYALSLVFVLGLALGRFWDHVRAFLRRGLLVPIGGHFRRRPVVLRRP